MAASHRISRITTAVVEANYDWTYVRIETEGGVYGTGECFFSPGLIGMITDLSPVLVGQDPRHIDRHVRRLQRAASGSGSISGVIHNAITGMEAALLDLVGKLLNVPIWQLLGGKFRNRVRLYADCHAGEGLESVGPTMNPRELPWFLDAREALLNRTTDELDDPVSPDAYARRARAAVAAGFDALKFDLDVDTDPQEGQLRALTVPEVQAMSERIAAVRAAVGDCVDVAVDCHWRYSMADVSRIARAMEPHNLLWLEDPFPPFNWHSFRTLRDSTPVPLCTGENLFLRHGFRDLIQNQAVHFVSPDLQKVGGLLEARRIADLAEMYDLLVAPHCIASPLGTLASAHLCAAIPNFSVLEFHGQDVPFWSQILDVDQPFIRNGCVEVTDRPGLGAELNEEVARRYARPGHPWFGQS